MQDEQRIRRLQRASLFTSIASVVAILLSPVAFILIVPQFVEIFKSMNASLPALTRMMITISYVLTHGGWACLLVVTLIFVGLLLMRPIMRHPGGRVRSIQGISWPVRLSQNS